MQGIRPSDEVRVIIYAGKTSPRHIIAVEDVLRNAYPGRTRSSAISETREGDGLHLILTIKMREAQR